MTDNQQRGDTKRTISILLELTYIRIWDDSKYKSRHIVGISKHTSEASLKHYSSKLSEKRKKEISDALSREIHGSEFRCSEVSSSAIFMS